MSLSRRDLCAGVTAALASSELVTAASAAQVSTPTKPRFIDTHHHYLPPFYVEAIGSDAVSSHTGNVPVWSVENSLAMMERVGIETAVLSISNPGSPLKNAKQAEDLAKRCNDFARQLCTDHTARFQAFAVLPMPDVDASLAEIRRALDDLKFVGVGLLTNYDGTYLGDPRFDPVFAELHRRKALVFVHPTEGAFSPLRSFVGPPFLEFPIDTTWALGSLLVRGTFSRFSDARFIFAHAGGTMLSIGLRFAQIKEATGADSIALLKRAHYDLALTATSFTVPALAEFIGGSQIIFGSDYPFVPAPNLNIFTTYLARLAAERHDLFPLIERENTLTLLPQLRT